jgi:hypothetical protein
MNLYKECENSLTLPYPPNVQFLNCFPQPHVSEDVS